MNAEAHSLPNRRGTAYWGFDRFKSDALTQLTKDLQDLEATGLDPNRCEQLQAALRGVGETVATIPVGSFLRDSILTEWQLFEETYRRWNGHSPSKPEARRQDLKELQRRCARIRRKISIGQKLLATHLDRSVAAKLYGALERFCGEAPPDFRNLARAVRRFKRYWSPTNL